MNEGIVAGTSAAFSAVELMNEGSYGPQPQFSWSTDMEDATVTPSADTVRATVTVPEHPKAMTAKKGNGAAPTKEPAPAKEPAKKDEHPAAAKTQAPAQPAAGKDGAIQPMGNITVTASTTDPEGNPVAGSATVPVFPRVFSVQVSKVS